MVSIDAFQALDPGSIPGQRIFLFSFFPQLTAGECRIIELLQVTPTIEDCERKMEALLYSLPDCQVTLDKVLCEYEKKFGEKLDYCGHTKLLSLLEAMPKTLMVCGKEERMRQNMICQLLPPSFLDPGKWSQENPLSGSSEEVCL